MPVALGCGGIEGGSWVHKGVLNQMHVTAFFCMRNVPAFELPRAEG